MNENEDIRALASEMTEDFDFISQEELAKDLNELISRNEVPNSRPLSSSDASVDELLKNTLTVYNEKYGINLSPESLEQHLKVASFLSKQDRNALELVQQGILSNAADHVYFKTLLNIYKLIDTTISHVLESEIATSFNLESVAIVNNLFNWLNQLEVLKNKFKIYDFDKTMNRIMEKSQQQDTSTVNRTYSTLRQLMKVKTDGETNETRQQSE